MHLPRDSAYVRARQGDSAYWDESVELLAQTVDAIRVHDYHWLLAHGATPNEPRSIPRPGHMAEVATGSLADFNALIEG